MNEDFDQIKHGTDNEGIEEENYGYSQAVSGLCDMSIKYKRMLEAECRYWARFKESNPDMWEKQLNRLKQTRGGIFIQRLLDANPLKKKGVQIVHSSR